MVWMAVVMKVSVCVVEIVLNTLDYIMVANLPS